jgi:hypothetical protein
VRRRPQPYGNTGLWVGMRVYESTHEMVGIIAHIAAGGVVHMVRPTGFRWQAPWTRVRPATEAEQRQLAALSKLHRTRCAGLAA